MNGEGRTVDAEVESRLTHARWLARVSRSTDLEFVGVYPTGLLYLMTIMKNRVSSPCSAYCWFDSVTGASACVDD